MENLAIERLTPLQKNRMERNNKLRAEYVKLIDDPEQSRMEVMRYLMKKYKFHTVQAVYKVIRRQEGGAK